MAKNLDTEIFKKSASCGCDFLELAFIDQSVYVFGVLVPNEEESEQ